MPTSFTAMWIAEAIRLREVHHGPIDDSDIIFEVRNLDLPLSAKIQTRAEKLAHSKHIDLYIQRYQRILQLSARLLVIVAFCLGLASAYAALGSHGGTVNLVTAWLGLLGPHFLMLLLWCLGLLWRRQAGTWLGQLWLDLSGKLARGSDHSLLVNALIHTLRHKKLLTPLTSGLSHAFWLFFLSGSLAGLLFLLATRNYQFVWATTILPLQTFDQLAHGLALLPALFGFPSPQQLPLISQLNQSVPESQAQLQLYSQWSAWLVGQVLFYGVLPRLLLAIYFLVQTKRRLHKPQAALDLNQAGFAELVPRLQPSVQSLGIDAPAPAATPASAPLDRQRPAHGSGLAMCALELNPDLDWPTLTADVHLQNLGRIDSREDRQQLLAYLAQHGPLEGLLMACDARQTPDRGILNFVQSLSRKSQHTVIWLCQAQQAERLALWQQQLQQLGFEAEAICIDVHAAQAQLQADIQASQTPSSPAQP